MKVRTPAYARTHASPAQRYAQYSAAVIALAAAYAYLHTSVATLFNFGLRYPFSDHYRIYANFFRIPLRDAIWGIENAHRPVVAALVRLAEMRWADADQWLQLTAGAGMAFATAAVIAAAGWRERALPTSARASTVLVAVLGVFWLGNVRMLFHGGEAIAVYPVTLMTVLAASCVYSAMVGGSAWWMALGGLLCTVATFSFGSGIVSFAALFTVAFVMRLQWRYWLAPAAILLADIVLYLYILPGKEGVQGSLALRPSQNIAIALRLLSSPWITADAGRVLGSGARGAMSLGIGMVGAMAFGGALLDGFIRGTRLLRLQGIGISLMALGIATAALIGLSRADLMLAVPDQVFADRYLVWSSLFWTGLAIYVGAAVAVRPNGDRYALVVALLVVLGAAFLWKVQSGNARWAAAVFRINQQSAVAARLGIWDRALFPGSADATDEEIRITQQRFRENRWSMFRVDTSTQPLALDRVQDRLPPAPAGSAVVLGETIDDPLNHRQVVRFEGRYPQAAGLPRHPALVVIDADARVSGEAIFSFLPEVTMSPLWNVPRKNGFDGYIVAPQAGKSYRVVLFDLDSGQPVHGLPVRVSP